MDGCRLAGSDPLAPATARRSDNQTSETLQIAIQTDAAINPGNSGRGGRPVVAGQDWVRGHIAEVDGPKPALLRTRTALVSRGGRCLAG